MLDKKVIVVVLPLDFHFTNDNFWQHLTSGTKHVRWPKRFMKNKLDIVCITHDAKFNFSNQLYTHWEVGEIGWIMKTLSRQSNIEKVMLKAYSTGLHVTCLLRLILTQIRTHLQILVNLPNINWMKIPLSNSWVVTCSQRYAQTIWESWQVQFCNLSLQMHQKETTSFVLVKVTTPFKL